MALYIALWIANLFFVINKKDNKLISFITYLILGVLFVSNAGASGDAAIYKEHFESGVFPIGLFEVGYTYVEKILYFLGVHTYTGLLISLFVLGSFFLWIGLRKYYISYHYVFIVIMPFIFPTYAVAIRFFVASTIMVAAIRFLNENKYLHFSILVICAGSFHVVSLFYIVFIFCGSKKILTVGRSKKALFWIISTFSILNFIISVMFRTNPLILVLVKIVVFVFRISDIKAGYATTNTNFGGFIFLLIYLCGLVTAIFIRRTVLDEKRITDKNSEQLTDVVRSYSTVNYYINFTLSLILPLVATNLLFYRLLTIGHISNAIALGMFRKQNLSKREKGVIQISPVNLFFILSCLSWLIPEIIGINSVTIKKLFEASLLFGN